MRMGSLHRHLAVSLWLFLLLLASVPLSAQQITNVPLRPGATVITGTLSNANASHVEAQINGTIAAGAGLKIEGMVFTLTLKNPLAAEDKVQVREYVLGSPGNWSGEVIVRSAAMAPPVLTNLPLLPNSSELTGTLSVDSVGFEIQVNGNLATLTSREKKGGTFTAKLETALADGDKVRMRQFVSGGDASDWSPEEIVRATAGATLSLSELPIREDTRRIRGTLSPSATDVKILVDDKEVKPLRVNIKGRDHTFETHLKDKLQEGNSVEVKEIISGKAGATTGKQEVLGFCDEDMDYDCREDAEVTGYIGVGIDTFASGATRQYLNPGAPNGKQERMVGGFDFAARLFPVKRMRKDPGEAQYRNYGFANQLWIYGETVHGVRSTDIDCSKNTTFPTCQQAGINLPDRPLEQILFTIRNASSLEAFFGLRYEFLTLNKQSHYPINVYAKAQAGFLIVSGRPDDVVDSHHVGLGFILTKSRLSGSYLEVGYGRNDLFAQDSRHRWKIDGLFSVELFKGVDFFAQLTADTDVGPRSDSVQSYFGFDFNIIELIKDIAKAKSKNQAQSQGQSQNP